MSSKQYFNLACVTVIYTVPTAHRVPSEPKQCFPVNVTHISEHAQLRESDLQAIQLHGLKESRKFLPQDAGIVSVVVTSLVPIAHCTLEEFSPNFASAAASNTD